MSKELIERLTAIVEGMEAGLGDWPIASQIWEYRAAIARIEELEADVERLKTVPMKYRRMAFNAQLQDENNELRAQLKEAQAEVERLKSEAEMREAGKRSNIRLTMELAASQEQLSQAQAHAAQLGELLKRRGKSVAPFLVEYHVQLSELESKLAASQANEVQLREALETAAVTFTEYGDIHAAKNPPDLIKAEFNRDRAHLCLNALSLTSDTTALEAIVRKAGEVMRAECLCELVVLNDRTSTRNISDFVAAIRALPGVALHDL